MKRLSLSILLGIALVAVFWLVILGIAYAQGPIEPPEGVENLLENGNFNLAACSNGWSCVQVRFDAMSYNAPLWEHTYGSYDSYMVLFWYAQVGTICQEVTLPSSGVYTATWYQAVQSAPMGDGRVCLQIDDDDKICGDPGVDNTWYQYSWVGELEAGTREVCLRSLSSDHNKFIDDFWLWGDWQIEPEPPGECTTLEDYDFDSGTPWTLGGSGSISGSLLSLASGDYAEQDFIIMAEVYTVTVVASRTSTDTNDNLVVWLTNGSQVGSTGAITVPSGGGYHTLDASLSIDVSGPGELVVASNQGDFEVDFVCLYPGGSNQCSSETRIFDFEDGYNVGDPNWDTTAYGFSQGWQGIEYPVSDLDLSPSNTVWRQMYLTLTKGHFENFSTLSRRSGATIKYNYLVVPQVITVTSGVNQPLGSEVIQILVSGDRLHWTVADEIDVSGAIFVATSTLSAVTPVYVGVAHLVDTGVPVPFNLAMIDEIEMDACYGGPQQFSECIVGDPDFDIADGYPSYFYWRGNYNPASGAATLAEGGDLYQDITPPVGGSYNVELTVSSTSEPCTLDVRFTNLGSTIGIAKRTVQCNALSQEVVDLQFNLPGSPITLWVDQVAGNSSLSRVCVTLGQGSECLNQNPDMQTAYGYTGDYNRSPGGSYQVLEDGMIRAYGVEYSGPPWLLETILTPISAGDTPTVTITTGAVPGDQAGDQASLVSGTTTITYPLQTDIPGGFGPTIWNQGEGGVQVLRYCVKPFGGGVITTTPEIDPFVCNTVQNADFIDGLQYWDSDNVVAFNSIASFGDDSFVAQGLGDLAGPHSATIRWLGDGYASTAATLTVASASGVFSATHDFSVGDAYFWNDSGEISGTTTITVSAPEAGLNLDFICLYTGEPGDVPPDLPPDPDDPGRVLPPGPGSLAECVAPPMGILPDTITDTLASLWPWGSEPTYYETLMVYNTAWVRFIGCTLESYVAWFQDEFWGEPWRLGLGGDGLQAHLDQIIFLLAALNALAFLQTLLALLQTIVDGIDSVLGHLAEIAQVVLYILGLVGLAVLALLGLLVLLMTIITLLWQIPSEFWVSFRSATTSSDAVTLPLPSSEEDPLYNIILGIQVVNQVAGQTILFPIVVLAVTVGSFAVLIWTINRLRVRI